MALEEPQQFTYWENNPMNAKNTDTTHLFTVKNRTEVCVPSADHPAVPYFVYLLKAPGDHAVLWKDTVAHEIGSQVDLSLQTTDHMHIHVGVIGSGITGSAIAALSLISGFPTVVYVHTPSTLDEVKRRIAHHAITKIGEEAASAYLPNLTLTSEWDSFTNTDIVIESISEHIKSKHAVYAALEPFLKPHAILVTNTSSLPVEALAKNLKKPSRFLAMHFFNPVLKMPLVEIMKTKKTRKEAVHTIQTLAIALGKQPVMLKKESTGLIVNRLLFALLSESIKIYTEGIADIKDIDSSAELGLHHPMGPFKLMDLIGLDVCAEIFKNVPSIHGKQSIMNILEKRIEKNHLGKKTGIGFYQYNK